MSAPLLAPPLLAHAGHWAIWVLYAVPVLIVLAATLKAFVDQRREDRQSPD
jgi:cytochrome c-type biogenesis protein CcmH/NrfF